MLRIPILFVVLICLFLIQPALSAASNTDEFNEIRGKYEILLSVLKGKNANAADKANAYEQLEALHDRLMNKKHDISIRDGISKEDMELLPVMGNMLLKMDRDLKDPANIPEGRPISPDRAMVMPQEKLSKKEAREIEYSFFFAQVIFSVAIERNIDDGLMWFSDEDMIKILDEVIYIFKEGDPVFDLAKIIGMAEVIESARRRDSQVLSDTGVFEEKLPKLDMSTLDEDTLINNFRQIHNNYNGMPLYVLNKKEKIETLLYLVAMKAIESEAEKKGSERFWRAAKREVAIYREEYLRELQTRALNQRPIYQYETNEEILANPAGEALENEYLFFNIKSDKDLFKLNEEILINYELKNVSEKTIFINKEILPGGNLTFELVRISKGGAKTFSGPEIDYTFASWQNNADKFMVSLEPGKSITETVSISCKNGFPEIPLGYYILKAYLRMYTRTDAGKMELFDEFFSFLRISLK